MTRRELNLAIFEGTTDQVLWQPRLGMWINGHRRDNTLPDRYRDLSDLEIYDKLGCSPRYAAGAGLNCYTELDDVKQTSEEIDKEHVANIIHLPEGELKTIHQRVWEGEEVINTRIVEFPVQTVEDLKAVTSLINRRQYSVDQEAFRRASDAIGVREEPSTILQGDGFTELIKQYSGLLHAHYLMADHPREMDEYIDAYMRSDERMLDVVFELPFRIFNLGDHTTNEFTPPPVLERYCLPRWQMISRRMTQNNRFVHTHWDGNSRHLLPYLKQSGLHAVEALTMEPMGDMTLPMVKEAVGDELIVLDMIPVIFFLPSYPFQDLMDFTKKVIDMFAPRLILGVSDELSQPGEIERIEAISELIDRTCGLAE